MDRTPAIFHTNVTEPSEHVMTQYELSFIGCDKDAVSISSEKDGRRLHIGASELDHIRRDCYIRLEGSNKPPNNYKNMIVNKLSGNRVFQPAINWGNVNEDTSARIAEIYFNTEMVYPNGCVNADELSSVRASVDGAATMILPQSFMDLMNKYATDGTPENANLMRQIRRCSSKDKIQGSRIYPSLTETWPSDMGVKVNACIELKSRYTDCMVATPASSKVKEGYSMQTMTGADKLFMDVGILAEYDFKECIPEQFGFNPNHLANKANYSKIFPLLTNKTVVLIDITNYDDETLKAINSSKGKNISYYPGEPVKMLGAKVYLMHKKSSVYKDTLGKVTYERKWRPYRTHMAEFNVDVFVFDLPVLILSDGHVSRKHKAIVMHEFRCLEVAAEMFKKCGWDETSQVQPMSIFLEQYQSMLASLKHINYLDDDQVIEELDLEALKPSNVLGVFSEADFDYVAAVYLQFIDNVHELLPYVVVGAHPWKLLYARHHMYPSVKNFVYKTGLENCCKDLCEYIQANAHIDREDKDAITKVATAYEPIIPELVRT